MVEVTIRVADIQDLADIATCIQADAKAWAQHTCYQNTAQTFEDVANQIWKVVDHGESNQA